MKADGGLSYCFAEETQKQKTMNSYQKPACLTDNFINNKKNQDKNIVIDSEIKSG